MEYLDNLTKEERFLFLRNELSYDPMLQPSMDIAWHCGMQEDGYIERIKEMADRDKQTSGTNQ